MNIILSVYAKDAFREFQLPSVNNADYTLTLRSDFFHLKKNRNIYLEVMDHVWSFKHNRGYSIRKNGAAYEGYELADQDVLSLLIEEEKEIVFIVKYVGSLFHAYEKFSLAGVSQITIGEQADNDIVYDFMKLVSRRHAAFVREGAGFKLLNNSLNGTYVNSYRIDKERLLSPGACIDIMGLRMIYLGSCLAVDTKGSKARINVKKLKAMPKKQTADSGQARETTLLSHGKTVYHRSPRTFHELSDGEIEIEEPPQVEREKPQPLLLTIGPSFTMTLPMIAGCILMMSPSSGGSAMSMYSGLVMSVSSAVLGVFWAVQNIRHQKKQEAENSKVRFESYSEYLLKKTDEIKDKYENASRSLFDMYPDAGTCLSYDESSGLLWNRNTTHRDYLKHRLGMGNVPFQISIQAPKERFSIYKDELADKPRFIKENYDVLYDVPVVLDLAKHQLIGIVGGAQKAGAIEIAKLLAAQMAANNCYTDVKLGFIYDGEASNEEKEWAFAKWLPHVWSEDKKTRYCAASAEQASDVFYELTKVFRTRLEEEQQNLGTKEQLPKPYYVLFVSDMHILEGELIARYIFDKDHAAGLTTFILAERYEDLPNACDFVIENTARYQGMYEVVLGEEKGQKIRFDQVDSFRLERFSRHLATLQVQEMEKGGEIPNALTFFEMLGVSKPQELPVKELWAKNRTYDNIRGMIGAKAGGVPCYLDVHEKYHGPHGLVAGTTGSGKSETLQTYMLSLAVNYSPDDIGFLL
ncbi:Type VII secretion system protein EssC [Eubacterium plexicaudatum ASF492]|nr:Type VII secretion system protein EssC [Eubacterium plexicaudatum ASF492]